ncbi:MAG: sugar phosphate isomerase/epimerase [Bacteroidales bacterium]|nr:sugar phosphate isomerase/epimerase [Bacteroidales bacterium]MBN2632811.1 sugar phosphate isomerase/epimerase [Bacteroidales bacterium]
MMSVKRRDLIKKMTLAAAGFAAMPLTGIDTSKAVNGIKDAGVNLLKISLNAYSFNTLLRNGSMSLDDLLEFSATTGFDGLDITGYYFPGYPLVPSDDLIYHLRKKAFRLGLDLGCLGVRNDFTNSDSDKRSADRQLVKDWVVVAHKIGAPGLRIFSGNQPQNNIPWIKTAEQVAADIRECADFAAGYGVMLALQNHNDFLKTSADVEKLMSIIDHEWVGLMLDIGSYRTADPYSDIASNVKHAITWQIKEKVYINDKQVDTDMDRIIDIVRDSGYRGYLPLETLGEGDPYLKVKTLYEKVKKVVSTSASA